MLKYIQAGYQNISIIRFSVCASENRWCPIIDHLLYYGESSVLIDTPIHIYVCTRGNHAQTQDYNNDSTYCKCTTNYGITHVSYVQSVDHVRYFSSKGHEFLNQENFC